MEDYSTLVCSMLAGLQTKDHGSEEARKSPSFTVDENPLLHAVVSLRFFARFRGHLLTFSTIDLTARLDEKPESVIIPPETPKLASLEVVGQVNNLLLRQIFSQP